MCHDGCDVVSGVDATAVAVAVAVAEALAVAVDVAVAVEVADAAASSIGAPTGCAASLHATPTNGPIAIPIAARYLARARPIIVASGPKGNAIACRRAMRPVIACAAMALVAALPATAEACPLMMRTCAPPQPFLASIVVASADDLVDMANVAADDADRCETWADVLAPSVWYGVATFSWSDARSFARSLSRALDARREAAEARAHAATYLARVLLFRQRAARLFAADARTAL